MTKFVNLTPHDIVLNGGRVVPKSGTVARVSNSFTNFNADGICSVTYGDPQGLPDPKKDTVYVVSLIVLAAAKGARNDLVSPATGHPDCIRDEGGRIVSVPGFVK